ncbi:ICOS ligand isoform X2 [Simochromis diagramma]|uniref:ICOS ligand isoform X2 n=1 Tax=Simochromis diagramma TaxID=43689 RepID=UPI001A7E4033|nr:ICOS ligand isoform X2 [Simochromis diagramma]
MMASTWSRYHFLTQRFSLDLLLSLVLTLTWPFTVTGGAAILKGEVGGNVTFHCSDKSVKNIDLLYLQRDNVFVNGYYESKKVPATWNNTKFDRNTSSVFMDNLKVSHSGEYKCHIRYKDEQHINEDSITLSVTAKYSRPLFSPPVCSEETQNCQTTCTSNNGYPESSMIVQAIVTSTNETIRQIWQHVKSVPSPNPSTLLFNITTTVSYNCSNGEIKFSCSVGDVTSDEFSVCAHQEQQSTDIVIMTAICILVVVVVMIAGVLCWRRWTGGSMRLERVNTNEAVEISLCEKNGEKEAA